MARITILRRRLKRREIMRVEVAPRAGNIGMFAAEFERVSIVTEIIAKAVHAVVAGETIHPEVERVCLGEDNVHLTVATVAGV